MPTFDVDAARTATPGCHERAFLNNAGAALPTRRTLDAVVDHLRLEARIGGYLAADAAAGTLAAGKATAARLLNANGPEEIAFTTSDTAAFVKVLWGFLLAEQVVAGDRVVVDRITYNSHYMALLQARERFDLRLDVLPSHHDGSIDVDHLDETLHGDVTLVCATMVGTHCGLVNPVAEVGDACRERGILYVLDACQAVGQLPVDVQAIGCDALTTTGRKWLRGPRGTGLLWVHRDVIPECVPIGLDAASTTWLGDGEYEVAGDARRFEEFEMSIASLVGLSTALGQLGEVGLAPVHERIDALAERLRARLSERPGVTVHDGDGRRCGIVTFTVDGHIPAEVVAAAAAAGVTVNASSLPWAPLDFPAKHLTAVVRASPHAYNTEDELDRLVDVVAGLQR